MTQPSEPPRPADQPDAHGLAAPTANNSTDAIVPVLGAKRSGESVHELLQAPNVFTPEDALLACVPKGYSLDPAAVIDAIYREHGFDGTSIRGAIWNLAEQGQLILDDHFRVRHGDAREREEAVAWGLDDRRRTTPPTEPPRAPEPATPVTVVMEGRTYKSLGCLTLSNGAVFDPSGWQPPYDPNAYFGMQPIVGEVARMLDRIATLEAELADERMNVLTLLQAKHRLEDEVGRLQALALAASQPALDARLEAIEDAKRVSPELMRKRVDI